MDINELNNEVGNRLLAIATACNVTKLGYVIHANTQTATLAGVAVMSVIEGIETNDQYTLEDGDKLLADTSTLRSEYIDQWRPYTGKYTWVIENNSFNWNVTA